MEKQVLFGIQIAASIFEVWFCYKLLFEIIMEKKLTGKQKLVILLSTFVLGCLLGANRKIGFFSSLMFLFCILNTCMVSFFIVENEKNLITVIVVLYYLVIALLDFYFAFLSISFLKEKFLDAVYYRALSCWKCLIYALTRIIIVGGILFLKKRKDIWSVILELKNFLWLYVVFGIILLLQYQQNLDCMVTGEQKINGMRAAISLMILIIIVVLGLMILLKNKMRQNENEFLISQDKLMEQKYQEIEQERENSRRVIHDIKNHFFVLKAYEREKNYEGIHNYLEEIEAEFSQSAVQIWTGNRIVDLILNQKKSQAEKMQITFCIQAVPIVIWPMKDSELCSFWGNLLDNAIEACNAIEKEKKWIDIVIERQGNLLFVKIRNSMREFPVVKKGKFMSKKEQFKKHGYGLKNVERIVRKYQGELRYEIEKNVFGVSGTFFINESKGKEK